MTTRRMSRLAFGACFLATVLGIGGGSSLVAGKSETPAAQALDGLPVNKWTLLPAKVSQPYTWSKPVYAASPGRVYHWGRHHPAPEGGMRNDMLAFDVATGTWVQDAPNAPSAELHDAALTSGGPGIGYPGGYAGMLPSGTPAPSHASCGGIWDSKRNEIVYALAGMTFSYNPATRAWRDFKAVNVPRLYGPGAGYDPVNDEIVVFPHFNAANRDRALVTGNITFHQGTWVYSYQDNTWRRTSDTFGSAEVKSARQAILELSTKVSKASDGAWTLRRTGGVIAPADVSSGFAQALADFNALTVPVAAQPALANAAAPLVEASAAAAAGNWDVALAAGGRALWALDEVLEKPLRVEPPARCETPLIYDSKNQVLVMFGGHTGLVRLDLQTPQHMGGEPGRLNDTWIYDCKTRQWRDASKSTRPPPSLWPSMVYDPVSGLVLLVTRTGNPWDSAAPGKAAIWGFDAAKAEWSKLDEQTWPGPVYGGAWTGWGTVMQEVALDVKAGVLLFTQVDKPKELVSSEETYALKLDVSKMVPGPAPTWTEPEPIRRQVIPPDDPTVVAKLATLPANKWVHVRPSNDGPSRDWGNAACDPVRGHVYYFGGGHSTYQVNDVAVYAPGVNKWFYAAGDHNDWVPPVGWDGSNPGLRGGRNAHHQRNSYVALDGRMYSSLGAGSLRWSGASGTLDYQRYSWFYDVDRGGVWRQVPLDYTKEAGADGVYGGTHLTTPDGRVLGFGGGLEPYDGRFSPGRNYFAVLDTFRNHLTVKKVTNGPVNDPNEDRPFCFLPDKNQVFFYEMANGRQFTWVYDVASNTFIDLQPKAQPPAAAVARTVEYINGQNAVFAVIQGGQWIYSFDANTWVQMPLNVDSAMGFAAPYAQTVYSAKYGVFVNLGSASHGTALMRPDISLIVPSGGPVPPAITVQPANQTVTAGQTATFSVAASGTAPLGYQWQRNGANIAGATSATYTTPATVTTDNGATYRAVVTNSAGSATSSPATLTVNAVTATPPSITTQPANQTVTAGQTATFSVVASGSAPLSYQWQKNGVNIAGATSTSYTTPSTTQNDNGSTYRVIVTNSAGSATSSAATLTVIAPPANPDADGDALPDAWEQQHFGGLNQGAGEDPDGDGATNLQEFQGGADPMDPDSRPVGTGLPAPWMHQDVGTVGLAGSAGYAASTFTVKGAGADIWGTVDGFHYVYQPWSGDVEIKARVVGVQNTDGWAKAGVMVREGLASGAKNVFMGLTSSNGPRYQWRASADGTTGEAAGSSAGAPYWVRILRTGNTFVGSVSPDGTNWTVVGAQTVAMGASVTVGLAVTAHTTAALNTASIDNVSVTTGGGGAAGAGSATVARRDHPNGDSGCFGSVAGGAGSAPSLILWAWVCAVMTVISPLRRRMRRGEKA